MCISMKNLMVASLVGVTMLAGCATQQRQKNELKLASAGMMGEPSATQTQGELLRAPSIVVDEVDGRPAPGTEMGPRQLSELVVWTIQNIPCSGVEVDSRGDLCGFHTGVAAPAGFPAGEQVKVKSITFTRGEVTGYELLSEEDEDGVFPKCSLVITQTGDTITFIGCRRSGCPTQFPCLMSWRGAPMPNGTFYCKCDEVQN